MYTLPSVNDVYEFARELFVKAQVRSVSVLSSRQYVSVLVTAECCSPCSQLSAECIIVSLVYAERLMENAGVLLLVNNWRSILLCSMLLASKVHQSALPIAGWPRNSTSMSVTAPGVARPELVERGVFHRVPAVLARFHQRT